MIALRSVLPGLSPKAGRERPGWTNWAGTEQAHPTAVETPATVSDVQALVRRAREAGTTVKMAGSGHSFTAISAPQHVLLRPDAMQGLVRVDREAMTVTARAGTRLKDLNRALEQAGLSLHNMGDIAEQTLAGAISTGTHGSGGVTAAGLAPQVVGFELVSGTGEVLRADAETHPELFRLGRVGLGALGILTEVTFAVEPAFLLQAEERPIGWDELLKTFDDLTRAHHHVDVHWFPHTDGALLKTNTRLDAEQAEPLSALRSWWDDDFLSNSAFGLLSRIGNRLPQQIPAINSLATRVLSPRSYSDLAHRVFVSPRRVVFKEMEYAVPREVGLEALREARKVIDANDWRIGFPVEIRTAPADDVAMSTGYGRDSMYLAFHVHRDAPHEPYFQEIESVMRSFEGRPHWGKMHGRTASDLRGSYPLFDEFVALRNELDPDRVHSNPYLRRILGE